MELWVAFGFGAAIGALVGFLLGRQRRPPSLRPVAGGGGPARQPADVKRVVLDEGAANVLNALNNRLAAIGALAELLQGPSPGPPGVSDLPPLDAERARALDLLYGEVRRAAEISGRFLELAEHPAGAAEPSNAAVVINGLLAGREGILRELGIRLQRALPADLPLVACPMTQLSDMFSRLLDFSLRRLRESQPPRELRIEAIQTGPSIVIAFWDSGAPLSVEAEQRLVSPFRFTQSGGGGEVEFALARALAQSAAGTLRLRSRGGYAGAEIVVTLPRSVLGAHPPAVPRPAALPRLRILVVDDDAVNRQAMAMLLEREGHAVVAAENGVEGMRRLGQGDGEIAFDAIITDVQMPRLGGRAMYEQLEIKRPDLAKRFVFVTGDQARGETRAFLEACGQPSVTKPYMLSELISAIGTVAKGR